MERSCAAKRQVLRSNGYGDPVLRRENDWPKLGIGPVKLKGHGKVPVWRVFDPYNAAALLHLVLRVDEQHGLPHVQLHLRLQESAVRIDDLCQGLDLVAFVDR